MFGHTPKFNLLFKKYRLQSELSTLSQLGDALAKKGLIYETSIFSHWQQGTRLPQNRFLVVKLIEIFIEKKVITTIQEANDFLLASGHGFLNNEEKIKLNLKSKSYIFQVPTKTEHFSCRDDIIAQLVNEQNLGGKVYFFHGTAGVGKTALAIQLGHILKDRYPDGALWYKIEDNNISDILFSIAKIFGEDLTEVESVHVRATIVRTLLSDKRILLFFDSTEFFDNIQLLVPNSALCTVFLTSQNTFFNAPISCISIAVKPFTNEEVLTLFKQVLGDEYENISKQHMLTVAQKVGNLPLAIHMIARQIKYSRMTLLQISNLLDKENNFFKQLNYDHKNLYKTISISYEKLDAQTKAVLLSASVFVGKDFSIESIVYINGLSFDETMRSLEYLVQLSLLEYSVRKRYRIHPAIKEFTRGKLDYPKSSHLKTVAYILFAFFSLWWLYLQFFIPQNTHAYMYFAGSYGLMALYGGICGIHVCRKWGGLQTLMGKAVLMFSVGLFLQEFGQLAYSYLNFFNKIVVPYPSLGDIGYFLTIIFYTYGVYLTTKSMGIRLNIKVLKKYKLGIIIPMCMLTLTYIFLINNQTFDFTNPIKLFLDIAYPFGEAIYVSYALITFLLARKILDGIIKSKMLLILSALVLQYICDFVFLYTQKIYNLATPMDYIYCVAYFLMTIALIDLKSLLISIKKPERQEN